MKIMYIIDSYPTNGGAPISTSILANSLAEESDLDIVLTMPKNEKKFFLNKNIKKVEIEYFFNDFPFDLKKPHILIRLAYEMWKVIRMEKPDIIHAQMPRGARAVGLLKMLHLIPKSIKLIYTDREHIVQFRKVFRSIYLFFIAWWYDKIISLTNESALYWSKTNDTTVIPNTAGKIYEYYDENLHYKMKVSNNIDPLKKSILFAGRMIPSKNWKLALEIISSLKEEGFHFIFAISSSNSQQKKEVQKFITEVIRYNVKFTFKENISQEEMSKIYYAADLFIMTSNRESFGRTAIEAMSRKCIVIGRNVGGLPEIINKKENILENDVNQFSKRIIDYKNNDKELLKDKEWFYERYIKNYVNEKNVNEHKKVYKKIKNSNNVIF